MRRSNSSRRCSSASTTRADATSRSKPTSSATTTPASAVQRRAGPRGRARRACARDHRRHRHREESADVPRVGRGGVEHRIYNPHLFGPLGFSRTHRKLAVIDDQFAFCGGINIVDDWRRTACASSARAGISRWKCKGRWSPMCAKRSIFNGSGSGSASSRASRASRAATSRNPAARTSRAARCGGRRARSAALASANSRRRPAVRGVRRARQPAQPARDREGVSARDRPGRARSAARESVFHAGSQTAARAGAGGPARRAREAHDRPQGVRRARLRDAVPLRQPPQAGVRIAEYEKTMLHGKVAVVDPNWATVGSSNLDALSLVLNNEANMVLVNHAEIDSAARSDPDGVRRGRAASTRSTTPRGRSANGYSAGSPTTPTESMMKMLTIGGYD